MKYFMPLKVFLAVIAGFTAIHIAARDVFYPYSPIVSIGIALFGIFIVFIGEKSAPKTTLLQS